MRRPVTVPLGALLAAGLVLAVILLASLGKPDPPGRQTFELRSPGGLVDRALPGGAVLLDRGPPRPR